MISEWHMPSLWHFSCGYFFRYKNLSRKVLILVLLIIFCFISMISWAVYESHTIWIQSQAVKAMKQHRKKYSIALATNTNDANLHYGIIVDCGSSGSRVFVYFWPSHDGNRHNLLHIQLMRDRFAKSVIKKVTPGLSSFVDKPSEASEYLKPLLKFAAEHIPEHKHKETPLYVLATAGMRLLTTKQQEEIMQDIRVDIPMDFNFQFSERHVEVISGKQEGVFAWIAINYILGRFDHSLGDDPLVSVETQGTNKVHIRKRTVGVLDMGGGSAQIAFEVPKSVTFSAQENMAKNLLAEFNLGCTKDEDEHSYRVYVTTFLGHGSNTARKKYEEQLILRSLLYNKKLQVKPSYTNSSSLDSKRTTQSIGSNQNPIPDPCLPYGMPDTVVYNKITYSLNGTGSYGRCRNLVTPLLNQSVPCMKKPCSMNGVYQPDIDSQNSEFYGFSEFYYTMEDVFRMGGPYFYQRFLRAAQEYCSTKWQTLESWYKRNLYPMADWNRFKFQCFKAAWMSTVLHDGFKVPINYQHLTSAKLIENQEVQWTLGALLFKTRFFPLREIEKLKLSQRFKPSWVVGSVMYTQYAILFCFVIVVASIWLYMRRLHIIPRSNSMSEIRRIPSRTFFLEIDSNN